MQLLHLSPCVITGCGRNRSKQTPTIPSDNADDDHVIGGLGFYSHKSKALTHQHWAEQIISAGSFNANDTQASEASHKTNMGLASLRVRHAWSFVIVSWEICISSHEERSRHLVRRFEIVSWGDYKSSHERMCSWDDRVTFCETVSGETIISCWNRLMSRLKIVSWNLKNFPVVMWRHINSYRSPRAFISCLTSFAVTLGAYHG